MTDRNRKTKTHDVWGRFQDLMFLQGKLFPDGVVTEDEDGQIVINTGLRECEDPMGEELGDTVLVDMDD